MPKIAKVFTVVDQNQLQVEEDIYSYLSSEKPIKISDRFDKKLQIN